MSKEEKAKELIENFKDCMPSVLMLKGVNVSEIIAKSCAIMCVAEVIEETRDFCDDKFHQDRMNYWQSIKQIIQQK